MTNRSPSHIARSLSDQALPSLELDNWTAKVHQSGYTQLGNELLTVDEMDKLVRWWLGHPDDNHGGNAADRGL